MYIHYTIKQADCQFLFSCHFHIQIKSITITANSALPPRSPPHYHLNFSSSVYFTSPFQLLVGAVLAPPVAPNNSTLTTFTKVAFSSHITNTHYSSHHTINQIFLLSQLVSTTTVLCPEYALSDLISREERASPLQIQEQFSLFLTLRTARTNTLGL